MDCEVQSAAASAEESAAAAEQLNAQAYSVKGDVLELLTLVGGRSRSMNEIVREQPPEKNRIQEHVS